MRRPVADHPSAHIKRPLRHCSEAVGTCPLPRRPCPRPLAAVRPLTTSVGTPLGTCASCPAASCPLHGGGKPPRAPHGGGQASSSPPRRGASLLEPPMAGGKPPQATVRPSTSLGTSIGTDALWSAAFGPPVRHPGVLDRTYRPKATAPPQARGPSPTADDGIRGPDTASPELGHTRRRKAASSASSSRAELDRWRGDRGPGTAPSESARAAAGTQLAKASSGTPRPCHRAPRTSHYPRRTPRSGRWGAGGDNDTDLEHGPANGSCPRIRPHLGRKEIVATSWPCLSANLGTRTEAEDKVTLSPTRGTRRPV